MPQPSVRVVGSGFTTLQYAGRDIAWLDSFTDSGQTTNPSNYERIYELGPLRRVKEIVTPYVLNEGSISATIRELWDRETWEHLSGLQGTNNIVDVFEALRQAPATVTCQSIIRAPDNTVRGKIYHNCVVTNINDGDTVSIRDLSVTKQITITYTHATPLT
jgi:hypothetical protein